MWENHDNFCHLPCMASKWSRGRTLIISNMQLFKLHPNQSQSICDLFVNSQDKFQSCSSLPHLVVPSQDGSRGRPFRCACCASCDVAPAECALGALCGAGAAEGGTYSAGRAKGGGPHDPHDVPWAVTSWHFRNITVQMCLGAEMVIDGDFCVPEIHHLGNLEETFNIF